MYFAASRSSRMDAGCRELSATICLNSQRTERLSQSSAKKSLPARLASKHCNKNCTQRLHRVRRDSTCTLQPRRGESRKGEKKRDWKCTSLSSQHAHDTTLAVMRLVVMSAQFNSLRMIISSFQQLKWATRALLSQKRNEAVCWYANEIFQL